MSASQVDPHDKMRARDVSKVARGEQAPRPAHDYGSINEAPPKPSSSPSPSLPAEQPRHCYTSYLEYHKCVKEKGKDAPECEKFERHYKSLCPVEWIERWDEQRENGTFPGRI
ncbi:hypothetical protein FEM48_Zijuj11G0077900 [Ziziphus jujuba var. spinosa]|uniref:Cytochrome c oxidase subunit 6b-3-like n=1 Tax=Ziziphus jujuba var. spinosa TaxID=714518 RepID=A0A978UHQ4_ZIZJJ|nr:hypothetical protein FEM48_Zijuj11G0077900 [Ziziphus jujuba var. spinosa]